jgi:ribosomal protein S18 acetylase RimI-like enzyme
MTQSDTLPFVVRPSRIADAEAVGRMAAAFADYLRAMGDTACFRFDAEAFRRDGFGPDAAFSGFFAEAGAEAAGYLHYHFGYDSDEAVRIVHVVDLWVEPAFRGAGIGRALMEAAAAAGRRHGAAYLLWSVYQPNRLAARFYEGLGARRVEALDFMMLETGAL